MEHGLKEKDNGEVVISSQRTEETLSVTVRDNGGGLPGGQSGGWFRTQIVRTLVQGELGGSIDWHTLNGEGTVVIVTVPMQFLHEKDVSAEVPSV